MGILSEIQPRMKLLNETFFRKFVSKEYSSWK